MLCIDFKRLLLERNPVDATRSERLAATKHYHACPACQVWLDQVETELTALIPKERVEALSKSAKLVGRALSQYDLEGTDPEAPFPTLE